MIDAQRLRELLATREGNWLEFKLRYEFDGQGRERTYDELAKDVVALVNTAGSCPARVAYLVVGAGDELRPDGTRETYDARAIGLSSTRVLDIVNARCTPPIARLTYDIVEVDGAFYGVLEIPAGPFLHELSRDLNTPGSRWPRGNVLIRRGEQVGAATVAEILHLRPQEPPTQTVHTTPIEQLEELLFDPTKSVRARRIVIEEARRLAAVVEDPASLEASGGRVVDLNEQLTRFEVVSRPLVDMFVLGCHSGGEWLAPLWADALSIVANPTSGRPGVRNELPLQRYPALLLLYAGGVSAVVGEKYANLAQLLNRTDVRVGGRSFRPTFGLVPGRIVSRYDEHLLTERGQRMPFLTHLRAVLRDPLVTVTRDDVDFEERFVRFEYLFTLACERDGHGLLLGSFAFESEQMRSFERHYSSRVWIAEETDAELAREGDAWPPLASGLFEQSAADFKSFKTGIDARLNAAAWDSIRGM